MARTFKGASLKLVFDCGLDMVTQKNKTMSKSYSNLVENANADDMEAVAEALNGLCKHDLIEVIEVVQNYVGTYVGA